MGYFDSSAEWQLQSSLLLQARPSTTRVTVKYKIPNLDSPRYQRSNKRKRPDSEDQNDSNRTPKAVLELKTYDPASGVCLKFKTDRAAEVGRLINGLGRLGRHMAALPEKNEDEPMTDAAIAADTTNAPAGGADPSSKPQQASTGTGKKKKKGKK